MTRRELKRLAFVAVMTILNLLALGAAPTVQATAIDLRNNLRITEVMYNPVGGEDFEYLELINLGSTALNLAGVHFTNGITFTFGATTLAPSQRIVIVSDRATFTTRYGLEGINIAAGNFGGALNNAGESLALVDVNNGLIFSFEYNDAGDWPGRADGAGSSLEVVNPRGDLNDPANWNSSIEYHGSPGRAGIGTINSIVVNEVLAHTDPPLEDAIELHNPTSAAIDVSGWFLSDDSEILKKFRIPNGTIIPANGYRVFYEVEFNTNNALVPFSLSAVEGDDVWLMSADASENLIYFIDHVDFPASENGVSFGRYPNGTGPLAPMSDLSLGTNVRNTDPPSQLSTFRTGTGAANAYPKVGPIVISQIMYHPALGGDEFVELRNITGVTVPLYDPLRPTNRWQLANGVEFIFPAGSEIAAQGRALVVAVDPNAFRAKYSIEAATRIYGPYTGSLDNAGETLELLKPDPPQELPPNIGLVPYVQVEKIQYDNVAPWPVGASGTGSAIKRVTLVNFGNDPANWTSDNIAPPERDSDSDGMPDTWETANGFNPASAIDGSLDADGDGMTNVNEFRSGTNPRDAASVLKLQVIDVVPQGTLLRFRAAAGKAYTIEARNALGTGTWTKVTDVSAQTGERVVDVTDPNAGASSTRFYRVLVQ